MAQFDVHRNAGRNARAVPFLIVVQSQRWYAYPTRLVLPLLQVGDQPNDSDLTPLFRIEGIDVVPNPLQMFYVPAKLLGPVVASLADDREATRIIGAIDEAISRGYR